MVFQLLELLIFSTHEECRDFVVEIADDGFVLGLWVGVLVKLVGRVDSRSSICNSSLTHLTMKAL